MENTNWNIQNIPDLSGKTIIVTGGNSGLGYEAVKALAGKNAEVILACRSIKKGEAAKIEVLKIHPKAIISVMEIDLMDLRSIHSFADEFHSKHTKLDILINNAGIMMTPYSLTKDGFESQIGTNHLGHFALTGLLLKTLKKTPKSRVVTVSSIAHKNGTMNFKNLLFEKGLGYSPMKAYGQSKLSNLLFSYELQRIFETNKIDCISVAAHPGVSDTNLFVHAAPKWLMKLFRPLFLLFIQPAEMGVLPELRAATDPAVKGGEFYGPNGNYEMKGYPVKVTSTETSHDKSSAHQLWELSEKLTAIKFQ